MRFSCVTFATSLIARLETILSMTWHISRPHTPRRHRPRNDWSGFAVAEEEPAPLIRQSLEFITRIMGLSRAENRLNKTPPTQRMERGWLFVFVTWQNINFESFQNHPFDIDDPFYFVCHSQVLQKHFYYRLSKVRDRSERQSNHDCYFKGVSFHCQTQSISIILEFQPVILSIP